MFPVKCKDLLPLDHLVIKSVAVRGQLGPLTVWVSNNDAQGQNNNDSNAMTQRVRLNPRFWTKLYDRTHRPSQRVYQDLVLDSPIRLLPGQTRVIYIHSTSPGDEAIVYDNSEYGMSSKRYEDDKLAILTGRAHVSNDVFGQEPIWGWGNAWRDRREFVGRLEYGTVYKLWNPQVQIKFGGKFQNSALSLFMCQRRWESPWSILPDECIFFILNMCRWDWFHDDTDSMKQRRRKEKARIAARRAAEEQTASQRAAMQQNEQGETMDEEEDSALNQEAERDRSRACTRSCTAAAESAAESNSENENVSSDRDEDMDEEWDEDNEDIDEEDEDDNDEDLSEAISEDFGEADEFHRANTATFAFRDLNSDDEEAEDEQRERYEAEQARRNWIRRQFARIHVVAQMEGGDMAHIQF